MTLDGLKSALQDRYRIERELGAGGMATVYLAEDLKHHRQVAIKVLRPELSAAMGSERFLREIETTANLRHPHILPLFDSGQVILQPRTGNGEQAIEDVPSVLRSPSSVLFYVMPFIEGESLRDRLDREKQLPIDDALGIAREVADALSYAHSRGVIHRDIKPENILLESGHAVVADFGIARAVAAAGGEQLTGTGMAIGTPTYMSPEQAAGERDIDGRSDVYALGCMLYEMLGGRPPFTGPTTESIVRQHLVAEPAPISQLRPSVPPDVVVAIQRALAKAPADRFNPVVQFAEALRAPGAAPAGTSRPMPWRAIVGVAVVLAAVAGGWWLLRPRPWTLSVTNIRQVTREPAAEIKVALSPDGREIAYEAGFPLHTHIEVRDVQGGRPIALTGDWQGTQFTPRWTPDGREIVFSNLYTTADHEKGGWRIPRLGGQAAPADTGAALVAGPGRRVMARGDTTLVVAEDGTETVLYIGFPDLHSFAWRGDGSMVAWVRGNRDYNNSWGNVSPSQVWVAPVGGTPVPVTDSTSLNVKPAWLPDGTLLFISNRDGARDVYAVRLTESGAPRGAPLRLTTGLEPFSVSPSADGRTLAYDRLLLRRNIYALPIPGRGSVSIRSAAPLTSANQTVEMASLSGDGTQLVFDSNIEGRQDLYIMPAAGGEPRRVTRDGFDDFSPDFSPDAREIVFHTIRNTTRDIHVIGSDGTGEVVLVDDAAESFHPAFSPDGLAVVYSDLADSSTTRVVRRDAIGAPWGTPEALPIPDGFGPRWSPDGTALAYFTHARPGGIGIYRFGGEARQLMPPDAFGLEYPSWPEWAPDGRSIYFRAVDAKGIEGLYQVDLDGGAPRLVVRFDDPARSVFLGSIPIGNGRFYFVAGELESDIFLMDLVQP